MLANLFIKSTKMGCTSSFIKRIPLPAQPLSYSWSHCYPDEHMEHPQCNGTTDIDAFHGRGHLHPHIPSQPTYIAYRTTLDNNNIPSLSSTQTLPNHPPAHPNTYFPLNPSLPSTHPKSQQPPPALPWTAQPSGLAPLARQDSCPASKKWSFIIDQQVYSIILQSPENHHQTPQQQPSPTAARPPARPPSPALSAPTPQSDTQRRAELAHLHAAVTYYAFQACEQQVFGGGRRKADGRRQARMGRRAGVRGRTPGRGWGSVGRSGGELAACWRAVGGGGASFIPAKRVYKLINNLNRMEEAVVLQGSLLSDSASQACWGSADAPPILLPIIHDQQHYQTVVGVLLRVAREAHVPPALLSALRHHLLAARGLHPARTLALINQSNPPTHPYHALPPPAPQAHLLHQLTHQLTAASQKQAQYLSLQKFIREKEEQISPARGNAPLSRKERFARRVRGRWGRGGSESSNFYRFSVQEVLQNSFRSQNECYRTVGAFTHLKTMFGHSADEDLESYSQIYNALLDRTENLIVTGGEEGNIKVWHRSSGALLATLRGHQDYLNKIDTSRDNRYLLTTAGDGLRFFDLRTLKPLGGWKTTSIAEITSFSSGGQNVFVFGDKGSLFLLTEATMLSKANSRLEIEDYFIFDFAPLIGRDNGPVLVISFSPENSHLLLGLETGQLILVSVQQLEFFLESGVRGDPMPLPTLAVLSAHRDEIIEVKWGQNSQLWATGSKDGRCNLWGLREGKPELLHSLSVSRGQRGRKKREFACTYICWNCVFSHFAAGFQETVEQQDSQRGQGEVLIFSLKQGKVTCELSQDISLKLGGIRAMDAHPYFPNILLICEAEGHIILFDLFLGCIVNIFQERGYHILHPQFSLVPGECRFAQDGLSFIVASEYGSVSLYGYDDPAFYALCPTEQFLATDFESFEIAADSMKCLPLTLPFQQDINDYPRGEILSIRGQPHRNCLNVNPALLLSTLHNPPDIASHFPDSALDLTFLHKIEHNLREVALLQQSYQRTYEQIESNKYLILFHERERQYAQVTSITTSKLEQFKTHHPQPQQPSPTPPVAAVPSRTRQLNRTREVVNYADPLYDEESLPQESGEEVNEEELPDDPSESYSSGEERHSPRPRRIDRNRRIIRRNTRQNHVSYQEEELDQHELPVRLPNKRRRREPSEDILDTPEAQPRKRPKLEEEASQQEEPKKFNRLRKHAESMSKSELGDDCYRCLSAKSTSICHRCEYTQQFCEDCASMRGRRSGNRFRCVICLFLLNEATEQFDHVREDMYRQTTHSQLYVPQLDDQVRFFFQGYEEFLVQNVTRLNRQVVNDNPAFRLLPHTEDEKLVGAPICRVISIDHYFPSKEGLDEKSKRVLKKEEPSPILMIVGLINEQAEDSEPFWVFYIPGYEFLLPETVYAQIGEKKILEQIQLFDLVHLKEEEIQVIEIGPMEDRYPDSQWKMVKVRKTEGKRLRGNTKQIERRLNIWRVSEEIDMLASTCSIEERHILALSNQIEEWMADGDSYNLFFDYVDFEIYPTYRHQIPVGVCLNAIRERLTNRYYTGYQSLQADIRLLHANSNEFNGPHHSVTITAQQLVNHLLALLADEPTQPLQPHPPQQSSSPQPLPMQPQQAVVPKKEKEQDDSTTKKDKRKKMSEDYIQPTCLITTKRRTRRDDRKKRPDSSDYSQELGSDSQRMASRRQKMRSNAENSPKRVTRSRARHT